MNVPYRTKLIIGIAAGILCLTAAACTQQAKHGGGTSSPVSGTPAAVQQDERYYEPPTVPVMIETPEEQHRYLVLHYWDNFNFADTTQLGRSGMTEQALVNFLYLLAGMPPDVCKQGVTGLADKALRADSTVFAHFTGLLERYLYNPNSPYRNDDAYIAVLEYITGSPRINDTAKIRPTYQLRMARKNRVGERAADFAYTLKNGNRRTLYGIRSEYTILFFNNPDCEECRRIKAVLTEADVFVRNPVVTILSFYPDEDVELWRRTPYPDGWINGCGGNGSGNIDELYDLRAIPTLYLLDREKRVLLKDVPVEAIADYLNQYGN